MAFFRGAILALLALPLAWSLQTVLEVEEEALPEAEPRQLLGGRAEEPHAVAEAATGREAESHMPVADQGVEDPNCPTWCFVSKQYWHVKCTYSHCANCPMCGPYDHDRKETLPGAEPQQLLGRDAAEAHAVAEVATGRAAESDMPAADQGVEDPNCPTWCFVSKEYWHVKCTYSHCASCPMCGPYDHDRKETLPVAEPQQLLGGHAAEAHAVAEVATGRAAESQAAIAHQVDWDPSCPLWCFTSKKHWHVKCAYSHCGGCPMCGPWKHDRDRKEALPEAEPQQLIVDRAMDAHAVAEAATERAAESHTGVADQVAKDSDPEGVMAALEWTGA